MSKSARYRGKLGSKRWRGFAKSYVHNNIAEWNRLLEELDVDYRFKIVKRKKDSK